MRVAREKMTSRAPQIFLISSARPDPQPPHPVSLLLALILFFLFPLRNVFYALARSYTHITCLHSGLSRKSCSTGAFFFFSLLSGPLSLSLSFSTSLVRAPFPARSGPRSGPGFSPVARTRVSYLLHNQFGATRYSSTLNS